MHDSDADKAAIMAVLMAETEAWLRRGFEALASCWLHSPQTRRMTAFAWLGARVDVGWEAIGARLRTTMERYPKTFDSAKRLRWEGLNIVLGGDMAWVSYDMIGADVGDDFEMVGLSHEMKVFHRVDGTWKIGCLVLMQTPAVHTTSPMIEVDAEARVLWMNQPARERIGEHPGLVVAAGRLRARPRSHDSALRDAVAWAARELKVIVPPRHAVQVRAVLLGDDFSEQPQVCWVAWEGGRVLVSFDDASRLARRIDQAADVYGLSQAQARLARLIVDGHDLASAATLLGVSVNTLRTHLQRMFDRIGVHSQAGLVRALLSAEAPSR